MKMLCVCYVLEELGCTWSITQMNELFQVCKEILLLVVDQSWPMRQRPRQNEPKLC